VSEPSISSRGVSAFPILQGLKWRAGHGDTLNNISTLLLKIKKLFPQNMMIQNFLHLNVYTSCIYAEKNLAEN
jgi:hypothetical protein